MIPAFARSDSKARSPPSGSDASSSRSRRSTFVVYVVSLTFQGWCTPRSNKWGEPAGARSRVRRTFPIHRRESS